MSALTVAAELGPAADFAPPPESGTVLECMPDVVALLTGPGSRCRLLNRSHLLDIPSRALESVGLAAFVAPDDRQRVADAIGRSESGPMQFAIEDSSGDTYELSARVVPLRHGSAPAGQRLLIVSDVTEVSEQRRREAALRRAVDDARHLEALGRLAGGIAHDFNNILAAVRLQAEQLAGIDDAVVAERAHVIGVATEHAAALVRQLLGFARRDVGAPADLDLAECVRSIETLIDTSVGPTVEVRLDLAPSPVRADPSQIDQIVLNLVVNAADAMPDGGTLNVSTSIEPFDDGFEPIPRLHAVLRVADTGGGMTPETLAHVFEPFFSTKGAGGTGLGLATVHGIVAGLGGHVAIDSEVGQGSVVSVSLPLVGPLDAAPSRFSN